MDSLWHLHGDAAAVQVRLIPERRRPRVDPPGPHRAGLGKPGVVVCGAAMVAAAIAAYSTWRASRELRLDARLQLLELHAVKTPPAVQDNDAVGAIVAQAARIDGGSFSSGDSGYRSVTLTGGFTLIQLDPRDPTCPWTLRARDHRLAIEHAWADGTGCAHDVIVLVGDHPLAVDIEGKPTQPVRPHERLVLRTLLGTAVALVPRGDRLVMFRMADNASWLVDRLIGNAAAGETVSLPGAPGSDQIELGGDIELRELRFDHDRLAVLGALRDCRGAVSHERWSSAGGWPRPLYAWLAVACLAAAGVLLLAAPAVRSALRSRTQPGAAT
jgi:hypothetical protein